MKEKLGLDPAFACESMTDTGDGHIQGGMSKRFYAACAAMQGLMSNSFYAEQMASKGNLDKRILAVQSYKIADELLKQENE